MIPFADIKIIESPYLIKREMRETERSRKRCLKKPWAKRHLKLIEFPDPDIIQTPYGLICHPVIAHRLRQEMKGRP